MLLEFVLFLKNIHFQPKTHHNYRNFFYPRYVFFQYHPECFSGASLPLKIVFIDFLVIFEDLINPQSRIVVCASSLSVI